MDSFFPDIVLLNRYYMGDSVILEPVARQLRENMGINVKICSGYPELFENHPNVVHVMSNDELRGVDLTQALAIWDNGKLVNDKLKRIYNTVGLPYNPIEPQLYLSGEEQRKASELRQLFKGVCIGVIWESSKKYKTWPYVRRLIQILTQDYNVFVFGENINKHIPGIIRVENKSIREMMIYLSFMDVVFGPDTGPMHIAGALKRPIVVVGYESLLDVYEPYRRCTLLPARDTHKALHSVSAKKVKSAIDKAIARPEFGFGLLSRKYKEKMALCLLEGLGGTMTLSDHAKKVYDTFGEKPVLVCRHYKALFRDNPYVEDVIEVGLRPESEYLPDLCKTFRNIAMIRTGVGKWYGKYSRLFKESFAPFAKLYESLPIGTAMLENYKMNLTQTANKSLGLPIDPIEPSIFYSELPDNLPEVYFAISNGVDTWHKGLEQTKSWEHKNWELLIKYLPYPSIQVGTQYDVQIEDVIDLRGKTSVSEMLGVLKQSVGIICTEGGLMHLGYALSHPRVFVMRGPTRGHCYSYPGQHYIDSFVCDKCYWSTPDWYRNCVRGLNAICMKTITPERVSEVVIETLVKN